MLDLSQHLQAALSHQLQRQASGISQLVLAYSGGLDSQVLLHLLAPLCQQMAIPLTAVHIHHGLNPQADSWAAFCQQQCQQRQVACVVRYVHLDKQGNIEQRARHARYQVLADYITSPSALLLTGHHADDQLETLLLALKRGAGLTGLAAMQPERAFSAGKLVRFLLSISRQQLHAYAQLEQLSWVEDASNDDLQFDRNFLRHQVTPILKQRWPAFLQTVARSVQHLQDAVALADFYTEQALADCVAQDRLNVSQLNRLPLLQQNLVIRRWLASFGLNPEAQWLNTLKQQVINARPDAAPQLQLGQYQLRRYQDNLYCLAELPPIDETANTILTVGEPLQLASGLGCFSWHASESLGALPVAATAQQFQVACGILSIPFKPAGKVTKPLKQWFKLWQVPPWQRTRVPLLLQNGELKLVAGYASAYPATAATCWLSWQPA